MQTGWLFLDNTWYWLEPSGLMATGFKLVNGALYHFSQSGSMSTGWFVDDGTWYCANATGAIRAGWFYYGSNWYWLDPNNNGAMLLGFQTVNGSIYYLDLLARWKRILCVRQWSNCVNGCQGQRGRD